MTGSLIRNCLYCGPRKVLVHVKLKKNPDEIACPTCHLDPIEVRMTEEVRSIGFEEAYKREYRRTRQRRMGEE